MSRDPFGGASTERDRPAQLAEQRALKVIDAVIHRWFKGGEEGWPDLGRIERDLISREILTKLLAEDGLELRC